jgi:hypothetical protein
VDVTHRGLHIGMASVFPQPERVHVLAPVGQAREPQNV